LTFTDIIVKDARKFPFIANANVSWILPFASSGQGTHCYLATPPENYFYVNAVERGEDMLRKRGGRLLWLIKKAIYSSIYILHYNLNLSSNCLDVFIFLERLSVLLRKIDIVVAIYSIYFIE